MCTNNMKQISLALYNYHAIFKCFPPAYIADKNGRPMHSWRVLILPFLDDDPLYKQYKFSEPWDGPNNKKLLATRPRGFACPSDRAAFDPPATYTSYVAVVGTHAGWSGRKPRNLEELTPPDQTILLVKVTDANIPWSEPRDFDLDSLRSSPQSSVVPSSRHEPESDFFHYPPPPGINVALADGSVHYLPGELLKSDKLPDLLKVGGFREEYLDGAWTTSDQRIHWPNCLALAVWLASVGRCCIEPCEARGRHREGCSGEGRGGDRGRT